MDKKDIQVKIDEYIKEKEEYIREANRQFERQVAAFDGAIMALKSLLGEEELEIVPNPSE